jgi:hypothetical protein
MFGELIIGQNSSSVDQRGPAHKGSTCKVSVSFFFFYLLCSFLVTARSKIGSADFDDLYVKRRGLAQRQCLLGVSTLPKTSKEFIFPQNPQIWAGIGISSINKTINKFSTARTIFAQINSINAACKRHPKF